ncbi:MAG: thiamine pyrophosphate-dependent enzyme, partial [bacterium]
SLNEATTFKSADWFFRNKKIIRVDIDINEMNRVCKPDIGVVADAKRFFSVFDKMFQSEKNDIINFYKKGIKHAKTPLKRCADKIEEKKDLLSPVEVCGVIEKMMPENTVFLGEGGNSGFLAAHHIKTSQRQSYYLDINTGTLGQTIAAAIGAKTSEPHRHVISICGDGAFLMNANELATAAEYDIPVTWIVFNNGCYGSVLSGDRKRFGTVVDPYFRKTNIAVIARGFGVQALEVVDRESLHNALVLSIKLNKPVLIDIKTNPEYEPAFLSYEAKQKETVSTG